MEINIAEKKELLALYKKNAFIGAYLKSSWAIDMNINEGKENVPTNVLRPFDSVCEMRLPLPAKYLLGKESMDRNKNKYKLEIKGVNKLKIHCSFF